MAPADGAVRATAPATVRIAFSGRVAQVRAARVLHGGRDVAGAARAARADARLLVIPVRDGGPGRYRVEWAVVGEDGHEVRGALAFRVRAPWPIGPVRELGREMRRVAEAVLRLARTGGR